MTLKTTITIMVAVILPLGAAWLASSASLGASAASNITTPENFYDFGEISMADGNVTYSFTFKNEGEGKAQITKIYTSCMCTTATLRTATKEAGPFGMPGHAPMIPANMALAPGETAALFVEFDPAAHGPEGVGIVRRVVYVETKGQAPLEVAIQATVTP